MPGYVMHIPEGPLPFQVKPFARETLRSYINRLTAAHGFAHTYLRPVTTRSSKSNWLPSRADRLAYLTGLPVEHLRAALPELRLGDDDHAPSIHGSRKKGMSTACRRCVSARISNPPAEGVQVWPEPYHYLCWKHRLWLGHLVAPPEEQIDLTGYPEILKAHVRHRRLGRRYGAAATKDMTAVAQTLLFHEDSNSTARVFEFYRKPRPFESRLPALAERDGLQGDIPKPYREIAVYPELVTLTSILLSSYWRNVIANGAVNEKLNLFWEFDRLRLFRAAIPRDMATLRNWITANTPDDRPEFPYYRILNPKIQPRDRREEVLRHISETTRTDRDTDGTGLPETTARSLVGSSSTLSSNGDIIVI